ncbi:MAG: 16S rRNA (guanine(966)-N(2))-methyltransferase RsmD [Deltaproteobacteria bacterium]|nr:16S rRNA (guanine(966)-N(2))-methyltransferase RsmD [Deltaproteobacteria bacterium]
MRIVAGEFKGRRLVAPKDRSIRPTSEKVREAVFAILADEAVDARVLDLFAGSGAMGIEALSRGAKTAVFVDGSAKALELVKKNVAAIGVQDRTRVIRRDGSGSLDFLSAAGGPFSLVFVDPPYHEDLCAKVLSGLAKSGALAPGAVVVVEHGLREALPKEAGGLRLFDARRYGKTLVSFFRNML